MSREILFGQVSKLRLVTSQDMLKVSTTQNKFIFWLNLFPG